ncbi:uncharacterized protein LOC127856483 isoform X1 [Dreissena polymorpha]|uniref:Sushi domain-containing protein n=1 Tax=Dreissena polymorpha TaxID=45954 RepID=A0A9D4HEH8_DREPO|nr:uncharacterized protein LOC127856483 isoform X1 [Dreissena polymorpha]KAH3714948.1 hypothetical protein DPMN_057651 [Dreissena polymorpha]
MAYDTKLFLAAVCGAVYLTTSEPYTCYGDICNVSGKYQYCDVTYKLCRYCADVQDDCFTRLQSYNCTSYCYERRRNQDLERSRVSDCTVPHVPENGRYDVKSSQVPFGFKLNVICDDGYTLSVSEPMRCGNFSTWFGLKPLCQGASQDMSTVWKSMLIAFGLLLGVSVMVNIIVGVCRFLK